jgi:hypothetical protein
MRVKVRRLNEPQWLGEFELTKDIGLDFSGVTASELQTKLAHAFETHPALTASHIELGRIPWLGDVHKVVVARRLTPCGSRWYVRPFSTISRLSADSTRPISKAGKRRRSSRG